VDLGIRGKNALVCGASRGLGKACAFALAREGVNLTIVARTRDVLERTGAEIAQATGVKVVPVAADLTTPKGRAAAVGACAAPDILVNNSQGPLPGNFRDWSRDDWIAALDDMMLGPIEMMRLTVDGMVARGFGRIVNIVSRSVKVPQAELGLSNGARSPGKRRHAASRSTISCRAFSTATRSTATSAACSKAPARHSSRYSANAPRRAPRSATAIRPSSARFARFCVRPMPDISPARTC
jgi:NAD(P)-dependent dehydrogenase (short-subunit alcohol dehydrogenase family)